MRRRTRGPSAGSAARLRVPVLGVFALGFLIAFPGPSSGAAAVQAAPKREKTVLHVDDLGRERRLPWPLERVAVLGGGAAEITCALGCSDRIVARSAWLNWPGSLASVPSIGTPSFPNLELLWQIKPDAVIADTHFHETAGQMEAVGVPVIFLNGYAFRDVPAAIAALARLYGCPESGGRLTACLKGLEALLETRLAGLSIHARPGVFQGFGGDLLRTFGRNSGRCFVEAAGGRNVAENLPLPFQRVSPEWVVAEAPDHLLIGADLRGVDDGISTAEPIDRLRQEVMSRPGIRGLACVRQGRVYLIDHRIGYGLRTLIGALHLAKAIHPERLSGIDPQAVHASVLEAFFGVDLDGRYFYP